MKRPLLNNYLIHGEFHVITKRKFKHMKNRIDISIKI